MARLMMIKVTMMDLGFKLSARPSAEAVVFRYRAIPDQVSPDHDEDVDYEVLADGEKDKYADNHGVT